jgi:DNA ligase-1
MKKTIFKKLALLCKDLESTTKRKDKISFISDFFKSLKQEEIKPATLLIIGAIFPEKSDKKLDVGWKTVKRVIKRSGQTSLLSYQLSIRGVYETLQEIAVSTGEGSRKHKELLLEGMFKQADPVESEILYRIIFREMRIGVNEGMMMEAIAEASNTDLKIVRRAVMMTGDIGIVAEIAILEGNEKLQSLEATLFVPLKPMLANNAESVEEVIEEYGGKAAFEYKYDGARIQIHRKELSIRVFSRRLSDVTDSVPDIIEITNGFLSNFDFIIEGEVVALGNTGRPLPFQDLMRRFTRVKNVDKMVNEIPLKLFLFDALYYDRKLLIDEPYTKRWSILKKIVPEEYLAKRLITTNPEQARDFLEQSIQNGNEGLMAKRLESRYSPGTRGKNWYKLKPVEKLDVVILAAEWGSGRRKGWLSNYHLGVSRGDEYLVIGKTFKGLTDEEFVWITEYLKKIKVDESRYTVYVKPKLVVEVSFNEIQSSPHYKSGYALRFARITRIRLDKTIDEADSLNKVIEIYDQQFKYKDKLN